MAGSANFWFSISPLRLILLRPALQRVQGNRKASFTNQCWIEQEVSIAPFLFSTILCTKTCHNFKLLRWYLDFLPTSWWFDHASPRQGCDPNCMLAIRSFWSLGTDCLLGSDAEILPCGGASHAGWTVTSWGAAVLHIWWGQKQGGRSSPDVELVPRLRWKPALAGHSLCCLGDPAEKCHNLGQEQRLIVMKTDLLMYWTYDNPSSLSLLRR